jgi:hypothetical protein
MKEFFHHEAHEGHEDYIYIFFLHGLPALHGEFGFWQTD